MSPVRRRRPASWLVALVLLSVFLVPALVTIAQAVDYPALTGRVVDDAHVVQPAARNELERKLADLEARTGIQFVVATVATLQGGAIEDYANGLFRKWRLGDAKINNGLLLLVATNDRKIRFEVGYGLEGTLTDAISKLIITNNIAPALKAGDYGAGLARGADDAIAVLTSDQSAWSKRPGLAPPDAGVPFWFVAIALAVILLLFVMFNRRSGGKAQTAGATANSSARQGPGNVIFVPAGRDSAPSSSGSSASSDSSPAFSGDGGSSGGGGASGEF